MRIEREQFADVVLARVLIRSVDLAVFKRAERLFTIAEKKFAQCAQRMNLGKLMRAGDRAERGQLIRRASLLCERPRLDAFVVRSKGGMYLFRHLNCLLQLAFITPF